MSSRGRSLRTGQRMRAPVRRIGRAAQLDALLPLTLTAGVGVAFRPQPLTPRGREWGNWGQRPQGFLDAGNDSLA